MPHSTLQSIVLFNLHLRSGLTGQIWPSSVLLASPSAPHSKRAWYHRHWLRGCFRAGAPMLKKLMVAQHPPAICQSAVRRVLPINCLATGRRCGEKGVEQGWEETGRGWCVGGRAGVGLRLWDGAGVEHPPGQKKVSTCAWYDHLSLLSCITPCLFSLCPCLCLFNFLLWLQLPTNLAFSYSVMINQVSCSPFVFLGPNHLLVPLLHEQAFS